METKERQIHNYRKSHCKLYNISLYNKIILNKYMQHKSQNKIIFKNFTEI